MQDGGAADGGGIVPDGILKVENSAGVDESNKSLNAKVLQVYRTGHWLKKVWPIKSHSLADSEFPLPYQVLSRIYVPGQGSRQ